MDFMTAVRTCLAKYVEFSGRARRSEFWYFALFTLLVAIVTSRIDTALGTDYTNTGGGVVNSVVSLALFLPSLAAGVRRLHDIGRSGLWVLLILVPILGWVLLIIWWCRNTGRAENQYGPNPKNAPSDLGNGR